MTSIVDNTALRRAVMLVAGLAVVVALVLALPGVGEVRERFASARPGWIAVAGLCSLGSMFGFVRALWAAFDRRVRWRRAVVLGFAEQAANVLVPAGGVGGPALGALVMRRAGVPAPLAGERHAVLFLATSGVSFVALAVAGVAVGSGLFGAAQPAALPFGPAAAGIAVLAVAIAIARSGPPPGTAPEGRIGRSAWGARRFVHDGLSATWALLRHGDRLLIAGAVGYYALDVAAL